MESVGRSQSSLSNWQAKYLKCMSALVMFFELSKLSLRSNIKRTKSRACKFPHSRFLSNIALINAFRKSASISLLTIPMRSFCCGSLLTVSVTLQFMFADIIFFSVCVAEWLPFGKELLTRLTICSLCI